MSEAQRGSGSAGVPQRIDVHQHAVPEFYVEWLAEHGQRSIGDRPQPAWSVESALAFMDSKQIGTGVLSVATPNVYLGAADERLRMARRVNDELAEVARTSGGRFRFFASLPLPDVDASLDEARRCLDELGALGVIVLTHVDGVYISDPTFRPVLELLDSRGSVLFVHPHVPPFEPAPRVNPGAPDIQRETGRAGIKN